jgi:hypothetical protein
MANTCFPPGVSGIFLESGKLIPTGASGQSVKTPRISASFHKKALFISLFSANLDP